VPPGHSSRLLRHSFVCRVPSSYIAISFVFVSAINHSFVYRPLFFVPRIATASSMLLAYWTARRMRDDSVSPVGSKEDWSIVVSAISSPLAER